MPYIFYALLVLIFSGCAHSLQDSEISSTYNLPASFRNNGSIEFLNDNKSNHADKDPLQEMKNMLNDKEFIYILDQANEINPDLLILLSKVKQAKYQLKSSTGALIPKISGGLDYSYNDKTDGLNGSLNFSWEIDIYGKLDALRRSKKELVKYAEENYINGKVILFSDTASYYFSLRKSYAQLTFAMQMLENYKEILNIYSAMRKAGLIDESKYIETTMDFLNAQNNVQKYQIEVEQNKNALYMLINNKDINISNNLIYNTDFIPNLPKINNIASEVILNRPDVRTAIYTLNSELYNRYSKKTALLPNLSLSGNIGKLFASSSGPADFVYQIIASLTAPLFNRQELYAQLKIQEETVFQAEQSLQKAINKAISEIENSTYASSSSTITFNNTKNILENAKISMDILKSRWENGLIDDILYLQSQNDYLNTFISFYNAWYENISSSIMLYKSFGGSFSISGKHEVKNNG